MPARWSSTFPGSPAPGPTSPRRAASSATAAERGLIVVCPDTSPRGTELARRARGLRLRLRRRVLPRRHGRALVAPLPDAELRRRRAGGADRPALPGRHGPARPVRPLHGRARGAHPGVPLARALPIALGVRPDRRAQPGAVGAEGVRRLPRPGRGKVARPRRLLRSPARQHGGGRSWSTRARPTSSSTSSSAPSCSRPPAPRPASRCRLRRQDGYDHSYYFIASFMADHLRHHAEQLAAG